MRWTLAAALVTALITMACHDPRGVLPVPPVLAVPPPEPRQTWILAGQSNAVGVKADLNRYARVLGYARGGTTIEEWHADGSLWRAWLAPLLADEHPQAFIWIQGEANGDYPTWIGRLHHRWDRVGDYRAELDGLLGRVRTLIPSLPIVVVTVPAAPELDRVRSAQRAAVAGMSRARLVDSTDLPLSAGEYHYTEDSYHVLASRIAAAVRDLEDALR